MDLIEAYVIRSKRIFSPSAYAFSKVRYIHVTFMWLLQ